MALGRDGWIADMIARLEPRAAALRADGTRAGPTIAACIDEVLARFRAELPACPTPPPDEEPITWASPVFNAGGIFDPFAGTKRQRMLASAATCEQLGAIDAAVHFRKAEEDFRVEAAGVDPPAAPEATIAAPLARSRRARDIWSGPPMPPTTMPASFTAGPQLGLFG